MRLSVMDFLNLWSTGVLELQGLPYAAPDRAKGYVRMNVCAALGVCLVDRVTPSGSSLGPARCPLDAVCFSKVVRSLKEACNMVVVRSIYLFFHN